MNCRARIVLAAFAAALALPAQAMGASRIVSDIDGPASLKRGQTADYTFFLRNTGSDTFTPGSGLNADLDSIPGSAALLSNARPTGGAGPWTCEPSLCRLAPGGSLPPGGVARFAVTLKFNRATTLDLDVNGNGVIFSDERFSIRYSGVLRPLVSGLTVPAQVQVGTTPQVFFSISEPGEVRIDLERVGVIYKFSRRTRGKNGRVRVKRARKCLFKKPKKPKKGSGRKVKKSRTRCYVGAGDALNYTATTAGPQGPGIPRLGTLKAGRRYRLGVGVRTSDRRLSSEVFSKAFKTVP